VFSKVLASSRCIALLKSFVGMRPKLKIVYLESSRSRKWHRDWKKSALALALSCRTRSGIQDSWIPASAGMTDKIVLTIRVYFRERLYCLDLSEKRNIVTADFTADRIQTTVPLQLPKHFREKIQQRRFANPFPTTCFFRPLGRCFHGNQGTGHHTRRCSRFG
jgi:hypothetical protein